MTVKFVMCFFLPGKIHRSFLVAFVTETLDEDHPLRCHLENRPYKTAVAKCPPKAKLPTEFVRRASGKSTQRGKPGNKTRKRQLDKGTYTQGGAKHLQLHRGSRPKQRRRKENAKRAMKAMKAMRSK